MNLKCGILSEDYNFAEYTQLLIKLSNINYYFFPKLLELLWKLNDISNVKKGI